MFLADDLKLNIVLQYDNFLADVQPKRQHEFNLRRSWKVICMNIGIFLRMVIDGRGLQVQGSRFGASAIDYERSNFQLSNPEP